MGDMRPNYALKLSVRASRPLRSPGRTLLCKVSRKGRATRPAAERERYTHDAGGPA